MRRFVWLLALPAMLSRPAAGQSAALRPLLDEIAAAHGPAFSELLMRVQDHAGAGVYAPDDLRAIARALVERARRNPESRPDIVTTLGQLGQAESVPFLMGCARSSDATTRLHAWQALGWIGDEQALGLVDSARAALARGPADSQAVAMTDYAAKAIRIKRSLRSASAAERFRIVRATLLEEPNWLVRGDIAQALGEIAGDEVWPVVFDAYARWPGQPAFAQRLVGVTAWRYRQDPAGFVLALKGRRDPGERLFGLRAINGIVAPSDMDALMDLAANDPDEGVREAAAQVASELIAR